LHCRTGYLGKHAAIVLIGSLTEEVKATPEKLKKKQKKILFQWVQSTRHKKKLFTTFGSKIAAISRSAAFTRADEMNKNSI